MHRPGARIVENDQQLPVANRVRDRLRRRIVAVEPNTECARDLQRHQHRVCERRQLHEAHIAMKTGHEAARDFHRERGLSDPARAHEGDQPVCRQKFLQVIDR